MIVKIFMGVLVFVLFPLSVFAAAKDELTIERKDDLVQINLPNSTTGSSMALGDLGADGIPEFVMGNGFGLEPFVRVFGQDGSEVGSFLAYGSSTRVGVNVVVCDLDGDGVNEIVTSAQRGGGPHVRVFNNLGKSLGVGTFVYDKAFRGGVNLTCGDLTGDGQAELVTLPAASGHPDVRMWNLVDGSLTQTDAQFIFDESQTVGLVGTISNNELFISEQQTKTPHIKTFIVENKKLKEINSMQISIDATGVASIVIHRKKIFLTTTSNAFLVDADGVGKKIDDGFVSHVGISFDLNADGTDELLMTPSRALFAPTDKTQIIVDLSEQRLSAYTNGILDNSFLISSGLYGSTPLGNHSILAKIPFVHYRWFYGENNPRNYDLGRVQYNLRYKPHLYIHYAYWHNNFGKPMSHGCINVSFENMKWLYEWATEGIEVSVVK